MTRERGDLDATNTEQWRDPHIIDDIDRYIGWTDPGEPRALAVVASSSRGKAVLDVGVGTGRTTSYLQLLTDDYVGIDYTPAMVERARSRYPESDLRVGDARDLSAWPDGAFALVLFSFNGLDAVDHDGRAAALGEFARVLAPGGHLVYSSLNKEGPTYRQPPWRHFGRHNAGRPLWFRLVKAAVLLPRRGGELHRSYSGWWQQRRNRVDAGAWGIAPMPVYDYRLLVHFSTLQAMYDETSAVGLTPLCAFGNNGVELRPGDDTSAADYFHLVARKP